VKAVAKKKFLPEADHAPGEAPGEMFQRLVGLDAMLSELLEPLKGELQELLEGLEGHSFGLASNKSLTDAIQMLLTRLGLRVRCPRCKAPAHIRCRATKTAKDGSFQFEHSGGRQTNHGGGTMFPKLKLVPAPPDRRRKRNKRP
jgi:hypothetical protein